MLSVIVTNVIMLGIFILRSVCLDVQNNDTQHNTENERLSISYHKMLSAIVTNVIMISVRMLRSVVPRHSSQKLQKSLQSYSAVSETWFIHDMTLSMTTLSLMIFWKMTSKITIFSQTTPSITTLSVMGSIVTLNIITYNVNLSVTFLLLC